MHYWFIFCLAYPAILVIYPAYQSCTWSSLLIRLGCEQLIWLLLFPFSYISSLAISMIFFCYCFGTFLNLSSRLFYVNPLILSSCIIFRYSSFASSSDKILSLFTSFNIGAVFLLMYALSLFVFARTHFSMLNSPLPPSYLFKYNLSTFDGGCSAPFGVIILCVLLSIFLLSCIVKSIVPALCQMTPTVHVIVLSIIFFEYSFELTSFFTLLRYFQIFFIALCLIWLSCSISKYLYPAVSISFISSLSGSFHSSECFILPCCLVNTLHLYMPSFIPTSWNNMCNVFIK